MGSLNAEIADALVSSGIAQTVLPDQCRALEEALSSRLPWRGFHVDWSALEGGTRFDWGQASDADASAFARSLAAWRYPELTLLFSRTRGLSVPSLWLADHLLEASCNEQQFFAIGGSPLQPDWNAVAELATGRTIWGHLPKSD